MCLSAAGHFQAKFMKLRVRLIKYDKKKKKDTWKALVAGW